MFYFEINSLPVHCKVSSCRIVLADDKAVYAIILLCGWIVGDGP